MFEVCEKHHCKCYTLLFQPVLRLLKCKFLLNTCQCNRLDSPFVILKQYLRRSELTRNLSPPLTSSDLCSRITLKLGLPCIRSSESILLSLQAFILFIRTRLDHLFSKFSFKKIYTPRKMSSLQKAFAMGFIAPSPVTPIQSVILRCLTKIWRSVLYWKRTQNWTTKSLMGPRPKARGNYF